jgi:two-component sensor histidine kinase
VLRVKATPQFSPAALVSHLDLDPVPASVSLARTFVHDADPALSEEVREVVVLLTSELVTNAILHARTPVQVGFRSDADRVMVAVADRVADRSDLRPQEYSPTRLGGRGLSLVADLSADWGTTIYADGKTVWFVLPRQGVSLRAG